MLPSDSGSDVSKPVFSSRTGGGDRYQTHVRWLRDSHFLRDLEQDNIDSDVIDEELETLRTDDNPLTSRERLVKFLRSDPVQTFLCAIVLVDASIVIAQILLDINSVKDQLHQRDIDLSRLVNYIQQTTYPDNSIQQNYTGNDVDSDSIQLVHDDDGSRRRGSDVIDPPPASQAIPDSSVDVIDIGGRRSRGQRNSRESAAAADQGTEDKDDLETDGGIVAMSQSRDRTDRVVNKSWNTKDAGGVGIGWTETVYVDIYRQVAHYLHYVSIVILGILLLEDIIRIVALGKYICRHKIEIFDALVIATSFIVDIIFVGGITGDYGQKAAATLFVLLVWRVARVVDVLALNAILVYHAVQYISYTQGIIMTIKQRQEFRIRLQRRARRKAEKKCDAAETDKQQKMRELQALQDLCLRAGIKPENIEAVCSNSKSPKRLNRMLKAFSSVARLSFGMTLPYHRPSQAICSPCRRQSRITRHPSDSVIATRRPSFCPSAALIQGRRRRSRQTASSDTEAVVTAAGRRRRRIDYDDHASCPPGGAMHHRRPSTRERSNSDATTYFMHHSSSGLSDIIPGRRIAFLSVSGLDRTERVDYRRVLFLDAADVGRYRHNDSMDSSSVDSMGVNVVWHCDHEVGPPYHGRDAHSQSDRHADDERGCSNWSSDGDAGERGSRD